MANNTYTGKNIKHLKGLEAVRHRSDMYVGAIDGALFHMTKEILDNSVDEFINGYATTVTVDIDPEENIIAIEDDGRGLPVDIHPEEKIPTMELLFTSLHSSGKFDNESFKVSAGKNGVGASVVNALSSYMKIASFRDGYEYSIVFKDGGKIDKKFSKKKSKKPKGYSGTLIEFQPDPTILEEYAEFDTEEIRENIIERTYSNANLKVVYNDGKSKITYHNPNGIHDYMDKLVDKPFSDKYYFSKEIDGNFIEVSLCYDNSSNENIYSFVNGLRTKSGTHETGLKTGLTTVFKKFITDHNLINKSMSIDDISGEDIRSGLTAIINTRLKTPTYRSQTKDDLSNPEITGWMTRIINSEFKPMMEKNEKDFKNISKRIVQFSKSRISASKFKDKIVNVSNNNAGLQFSHKFSDCVSNDPSQTELFIVEGDSAKGSVIEGRIAEFQAVMPLRGKPLNSHDKKTVSLLTNEEYEALIKIIFGTTDIPKISVDDVRYNKIIIMCDSDEDGGNVDKFTYYLN